jgi:hypothetical protein
VKSFVKQIKNKAVTFPIPEIDNQTKIYILKLKRYDLCKYFLRLRKTMYYLSYLIKNSFTFVTNEISK